MVRSAAVAAFFVFALSSGAFAGPYDDPGNSDAGLSSGQAASHDPSAHGNGSLGTLDQSDLDRVPGSRDADLRGSTNRDDEGANMKLNMPDATLPDENSVTRPAKAAVSTAPAGQFNPADFASLDAIGGLSLDGVNVETKTGESIGHVGNVAITRGHIQFVTVDLDEGRSVKIAADKLRYNRKDAFLLTNLDVPELEQQASGG